MARGEVRHGGPRKPPPPPRKSRVRFTAAMEERLRTMAAQGHPATSITKALQLLAPMAEIGPDTVRRKASSIGVRLKHGRHKSCRIDFEVTSDMLETLRGISYRRGLSVRQFARLVVETVIRDGLVDALFDTPTRSPIQPGKLGGRPRVTQPAPVTAAQA